MILNGCKKGHFSIPVPCLQHVMNHSVLAYHQTNMQLLFRNEIDITMVNTTMKRKLGRWSQVDGLKMDVEIKPTKRFFRIGTGEVSTSSSLYWKHKTLLVFLAVKRSPLPTALYVF